MKTKITLLFIVLISISSFAQYSVSSYFGTIDYNYTNLNPEPFLNHSTAGANVVWNFSDLPTNGTTAETNELPTTTELSTFPNTTTVHRITTTIASTNNTANIYSNITGSNVHSFTGFDSNGIVFNYNVNQATIGTFPLSYGFSNTDTSAGTFSYSTYNGTFTGTMITEYDSYGTLNLGVNGYNSISVSASRVKQVQNFNLFYSILGNIGTVIQTTYTYYVDNNGVVEPFFRDTTYDVNVPIAGFVQTNNQAQVFTNALQTLTNTNFSLDEKISIFPNPTSNKISILSNNNEVSLVSIYDINGRTVLEINNTNTVDISNLSNGMYYLKIKTNSGIVNKKIIKN